MKNYSWSEKIYIVFVMICLLSMGIYMIFQMNQFINCLQLKAN